MAVRKLRQAGKEEDPGGAIRYEATWKAASRSTSRLSSKSSPSAMAVLNLGKRSAVSGVHENPRRSAIASTASAAAVIPAHYRQRNASLEKPKPRTESSCRSPMAPPSGCLGLRCRDHWRAARICHVGTLPSRSRAGRTHAVRPLANTRSPNPVCPRLGRWPGPPPTSKLLRPATEIRIPFSIHSAVAKH